MNVIIKKKEKAGKDFMACACSAIEIANDKRDREL